MPSSAAKATAVPSRSRECGQTAAPLALTEKKTMSICPLCHHVIAPARLNLPPIKGRILEAVARYPDISAERLREIIWAGDPNGGPEDRKVLHVHVHQLNKTLAPHGVVVRARKGAGAGYRLRERASD